MKQDQSRADHLQSQQSDGVKITEPEKKKKNRKWIMWLILIVLAIAIPLIIYIAKQCEISNLKERQQHEIAGIKMKAGMQVYKNNEANLKTVARVLSWAVGSELMRGGSDQASGYLTEMVKTGDYKRIILFAADGSVLASTDKKFEGEKFPALILNQIQGGDQISTAPQENGDLIVASPVMGMDKKLGTLVITYKPAGFDPDSTADPSE